MKYCTCKAPEPEEIEKGQVYCMKCELEIERHEDAPEPDYDDSADYRERMLEQDLDQQEQEKALI